ncbi:MAG TPA: TIGR02302 family protein [Rhizomicrobium sp.]|nr:TIGR02302 family protein [Rhizomicrobium sp.]
MTRLSPPTEFQTGSDPRPARAVAVARAALAWERAWPSLWPATGIAGAFAAAALFGLPELLPWPLHALLLAVVVSSIGLTLYLAFEAFAWPSWREGARRVERDSTLVHRPISEAADTIGAGAGDALAEALWQAHLRRRLADLGHLRLTFPRSSLPARDPRALRYVVLLLIAAGIVVAGTDWRARLAAAFGPGAGEAANIALDAWIDPPAYTGEAPVYLSQSGPGTITVPTGSTLNLRVHGASHAPYISVDGADFKGGAGEYSANARIADDTTVRVRAGGRTIGDWRLRVLADDKPMIAFSAPPGRTEHEALKLSFTAGDDYGVTAARAIVTPHGRYGQKLIVDLPLDQPSAKTVTQTSFLDLTAHPYAGLDVDIVLEAVDGAGQTGISKPMRFTLPQRVFTNPLARALIEQRQVLGTGNILLRPRVVASLQALTIAPDLFYQDKLGVYLSIRSALWTLQHAAETRGTEKDRDAEYARVSDMLWQIAVGLERGGLLSAAEELRRLQQMLAQALAQNAPQEVIDSLLERYREALQRYLQALAQNPPDAGAPPAPDAKVMSEADLQALLKAIEQLAQSGDRAQAAQMLALLQNLLENLHMTQGSGGNGQQSPEEKALSDAIQGLGDLMGKQRGLVDKTFREQQGKGDPKDGGAKGLAQQQQQLHDKLNELLKGLGGQKLPQPKSLDEAGKSMGQAENELNGQDLPNAGIDQKNALDAMRQSAADLAKELMKRSGQQGQQGTDPLGRAQGGNGEGMGGDVKVPSVSDLQRAREILKELRKRAAERGRPQQELDYIDRLLKQF